MEPPQPGALGSGCPHSLPVLLATCSEPGSGIGVLEANSPGGTGASLPEPQDPRARETCSDKLLSSWAQNRPRKKLRLEPPDSGLPGASVSGAVWVEFP